MVQSDIEKHLTETFEATHDSVGRRKLLLAWIKEDLGKLENDTSERARLAQAISCLLFPQEHDPIVGQVFALDEIIGLRERRPLRPTLIRLFEQEPPPDKTTLNMCLHGLVR